MSISGNYSNPELLNNVSEQKKLPTIVPNKFTSRGNFQRKNYALDYKKVAQIEESYREFLEKKRKNV